MAGNTVTVFKSVKCKRAYGLTVFVKLFKVVAVSVSEPSFRENSRIERQRFGTKPVEKIGLKLYKTYAGVKVVKRVVSCADYTVYKIKSVFAVNILFPVIKGTNQFLAVLRKSVKTF